MATLAASALYMETFDLVISVSCRTMRTLRNLFHSLLLLYDADLTVTLDKNFLHLVQAFIVDL
jgi:hypothetical protein